MAARRWALLIATLTVGATLTGCLGGGDDETPASVTPPADNSTNQTTELPTGDTCIACEEINVTEEGVGGVDHKHDYWGGAESIVVFDDRVYFDATPIYPEGEGSQARSVAYVKLPCVSEGEGACRPALVYEGADRVTVVVSDPALSAQCQALNCSKGALGRDVPSQPQPTPPAVSFEYRSAADAEWREPVLLTYDTPLDVQVGARETDMPHSVRSLWVFRLMTDGTSVSDVQLTITAHKGRDVVDWPGHPDFYAESDSRKVMDQHVTTRMSGVKEGYLYDAGGTWATPEKLISHGTTKLLVIANVTSVTTATGQKPTGFFLESHDATVIGPEIRFGDRWSDLDGTNDLVSYDFEIPVTNEGMDGPYQPSSRWGFRLMATFADVDVPQDAPVVGGFGVGLCPACFEYTIEYDIVVIAIHEPDKAADAMTS